MKLKKVLSICKTNGLYYLYDRIDRSGEITQWLGDACALYPLDGLPILDEESFCAVFDITGKQREKILFRHERLPEHLNVEDVAAGDKLVREYETTFINGGLRLKPLKTNNGVMFIRSLYLSPLEDVISGMNGRKWTKHGKLPYITYDTAGGAQDGAGSTTKPSGTTTTPATLAFAVGDVVRFTGNTHYTNAAAASGAACKPGTAKVTALAKGAKHPYHLIKQPGGGSTVYGWVNAADVQAVGSGTTAPKMRVGAKVKYSGPLYRDSNGGGQGKTVNGTYTVKYYYPGRKCGVHIDGLGWVPESGCTVIG